jgi:hypothetical protein
MASVSVLKWDTFNIRGTHPNANIGKISEVQTFEPSHGDNMVSNMLRIFNEFFIVDIGSDDE